MLLTIIVIALVALALGLATAAVVAMMSGNFGVAVKALLSLVATIVIGVAGIGKILAGKSKR